MPNEFLEKPFGFQLKVKLRFAQKYRDYMNELLIIEYNKQHFNVKKYSIKNLLSYLSENKHAPILFVESPGLRTKHTPWENNRRKNKFNRHSTKAYAKNNATIRFLYCVVYIHNIK